MDKTVCVKTLGCKVNAYESEFIISLFLRAGYSLVSSNASVYVINTCTVTNESDKKSRKTINSIKKNNPNSIIIAVGCYPQNLYNSKTEIDINANIILGNKDKSRILEYLDNYLKTKKQIIKFYDTKDYIFEDMEIENFSNHTRAFVKIEDGCNNYCTYCIIPHVRGNVRSKDKYKVIEEVCTLVKNGYKEIVLTGIHTGQYGKDIKDYNLFHLLLDLSLIEGLERIRISSIEIIEIDDNIIRLLSHPKMASHLHLPLQNGSDNILKLMGRNYNTEYYENKIKDIRKSNPGISITTDVIVGFPGETEEDFNATLNFCKKIEFSKIHVFPYSDRFKTPSSQMANKVAQNIKKGRVRRLLELSDNLQQKYEKNFKGKKLKVLIERQKDGIFYGYSSNYIEVLAKGKYKLNNIYELPYL